jgi:hypothetical protein
MGAECAQFEWRKLGPVNFCGRAPDFLLEVSANCSQSQERPKPETETGKANDPQRLTRCGSFGKNCGDEKLLSFAKDAIYLGATDWADALCHATTRVGNLYSSFKITLLFALNAVSVTFVCLCHVSLQSTRAFVDGIRRNLLACRNYDTPAHAQNGGSERTLWEVF